jgi:hypothetical protein
MMIGPALQRMTERDGQKAENIPGEEETKNKADAERQQRPDQPLSEFDKMFQKRRLARLNLRFFVRRMRAHGAGGS